MAKFETTTLTGKVMYPKVLKPQPNFNKELEYSIEVEVDEEKFKELKTQGLSRNAKLREHPNGMKAVKFTQRAVSSSGVPITIPVVDKDGNKLESLIGNGSTCTVKLTRFESKQYGPTLKLTAVRVDDLIPYDSELTPEKREELALQGLVDKKTTEDKGFI